MPRWLPSVLTRLHELAAQGAVRLTSKAEQEAVDLGLAPEDVRDVVMGLCPADSTGRVASSVSGEWMYTFKPEVGGEVIYVKLVLRETCVVVSFHEDEGPGHEEDA